MAQFYINRELISAGRVLLMGDEAHHAKDVFRMKEGEGIRLFDGKGRGYKGRIIRLAKDELEVEIQSEHEASPKKGPKICLAQSTLPRDAMDWAIRKATELGVDEIVPLGLERSVARMNMRRKEDKKGHWEKIILSASKQCGRLNLPELRSVTPLKEFITSLRSFACVLLADTKPGAQAIRDLLSKKELTKDDACLLIVGPEGGFTEEELRALRESGAESVSLGGEILRSETAGIFMVSVFHYLYG